LFVNDITIHILEINLENFLVIILLFPVKIWVLQIITQ